MKLERKIYLAVLVAVIAVSLIMGLTTFPPLIGLWEGAAFLHMSAPKSLPLDFRIPPGGYIGSYRFFTIDATRFLTEYFGISELTVRALPILYGFLSLLLTFVLARRLLGTFVALCSVGLLATNQSFYVYQHQMIVATASLAAILFVIERYQVFSTKLQPVAAFTFGISCALAATQHGPVRYYMLLALLISMGICCLKKTRMKLALFVLGGLFLTLAVLHPQNLRIFLNPNEFPSPPGSEGAESFKDVVNAVPTNLKLLGCFFTTACSDKISPHSTDIIVSQKFRIIEPEQLPFFLIGVLFLAFQLKGRLLLLAMLAVTLLTPLLSVVFVTNGIAYSTISSYRMIYAVVPVLMTVALGLSEAIKYLNKSVNNTALRQLSALLAIPLLVIGLWRSRLESKRMTGFVSNYPCTSAFKCGQGQTERPDWNNTMLTPTLVKGGEHEVYNEHIAFHRMSEQIHRSALANNNPSAVTLLNVSQPLSKPTPWNGAYSMYNFKPFFLAYYLRNHGLQVSFLRMFEENPSPDNGRIYPAAYDMINGEYEAILKKRELRPEIAWNGAADEKPRFFLVTTPSELKTFNTIAQARGWKVQRL